MKTCRCFLQGGLTLLELTVVLLVLTALAGLAIPYVGGVSRSAACQATDATMHAVKEAIMGGPAGAGYYADMLGHYPSLKGSTSGYALTYLFENGGWQAFNPKSGVGWRGPYLSNGGMSSGNYSVSFGEVFDPSSQPDGKVHVDHNSINLTHVLDGWHRPIVLQVPYDTHEDKYNFDYARLVSAGPGRGIGPGDAVIDTEISDLKATNREDDRVLYLKYPDPKPGGNQPCHD